MTLNIIVNGAQGKMGRATCAALKNTSDLQLIAQSTKESDLNAMIKALKPDIVIDFTTPNAVYDNCKTIIDNNVRLLVGTTGLTQIQLNELKKLCEQRALGAIIAPNFSLGAILMMRYAQDAAQYFPDSEIIEMHHHQKLDQPSGTAIKTAELMSENQPKKPTDSDPCHGIPVHSVRLPGLFAHQSVIFGGAGETLTIRHDALTRESMMPGVLLACRKLMTLDHLIYGLEKII